MSQQQPDPAESVFGASDAGFPESEESGVLLVDEPETAGPGLLARTGAELFGTFVLVFAGLGTLLYAKLDTSGGSLTVAVAFGIAAAVVLATVGRVSGGHVNPAVSLGAAIAGRLSWADLLPYWLAQLVGGALGAAVLWLTVPTGLAELISGSEDKHLLLGTTANGFGDHSALAHLLENSASAGKAQFSLAAALLVELLAGAAVPLDRASLMLRLLIFIGGGMAVAVSLRLWLGLARIKAMKANLERLKERYLVGGVTLESLVATAEDLMESEHAAWIDQMAKTIRPAPSPSGASPSAQ